MKALLRRIRRIAEMRRTLAIIRLGLRTRLARLRGRKIVLFHVQIRGQEDYVAPVIREMRTWRHPACILLAMDGCLHSDAAIAARLAGIDQQQVLRKDIVKFLGPIDAFVSVTQWAACPEQARLRLCMFHGQPSKGNTFVPERIASFNGLFILGPLQKNLYQAFALAHPHIAARIRTFDVGYPKSDSLINGSYNRSRTLANLGLPSDRPAVLFAPAFDPGTSLESYGDLIVEKLLESGTSVIVKLHPVHYNMRLSTSAINWPERLKRFDSCDRFRHVGNVPLDPFLVASDVLVTDVSGAALEFMVLDKPVIFIDCPRFFAQTLGTGPYVRSGDEVLNDIGANAGRSAGCVVPDPGHLPEAIRRSLQYPGEFSAQRQSVRTQLLYNPGWGAKTAAETLLRLLNETDGAARGGAPCR